MENFTHQCLIFSIYGHALSIMTDMFHGICPTIIYGEGWPCEPTRQINFSISLEKGDYDICCKTLPITSSPKTNSVTKTREWGTIVCWGVNLYASLDLVLPFCFSFMVVRPFSPYKTAHVPRGDNSSFSSYSYHPPHAPLLGNDCALD